MPCLSRLTTRAGPRRSSRCCCRTSNCRSGVSELAMDGERDGFRALASRGALGVLGAAALYLAVLALSGASLHTIRVNALPLFAIALVAGVVAWVGWRDERAARRRAARREAAARGRVDTELRREGHTAELERELADLRERHQDEMRRERDLRTRLESARQAERAWNRELRGQVVEMHRERGLLGDTHDVRALVLHIAVTLLEAEKGMLLS